MASLSHAWRAVGWIRSSRANAWFTRSWKIYLGAADRLGIEVGRGVIFGDRLHDWKRQLGRFKHPLRGGFPLSVEFLWHLIHGMCFSNFLCDPLPRVRAYGRIYCVHMFPFLLGYMATVTARLAEFAELP